MTVVKKLRTLYFMENTPLQGDTKISVIEIVVNGDRRAIQNDATVAALLGELGMADRHVAVEVNEELIPRDRHADRLLGPGDRLEIVTLVGGG